MPQLNLSAPSVEAIRESLRQVIDPEVGVNIVDLGLVYTIESAPEHITIIMTMTSPACPMGPYLQEEVETCLRSLTEGAIPVDVQVVWEPVWSPEKMSSEARTQLGLM